jgi:hypothetical protein
MNRFAFILIAIVSISLIETPSVLAYPVLQRTGNTCMLAHSNEPYLLVGGQNGTWFQTEQWPKLDQIYLTDLSSVKQLALPPSQGAVWAGGWNGSQWLISGYGVDNDSGSQASNPFIYLYNGCNQLDAGQYLWTQQGSWHGGDVFAVSNNGSKWLLSGLGSDSLTLDDAPNNHMSLALYNGSNNFTDLSLSVPDQQDAILYANAWNGKYWLVGGGYGATRYGVLFAYNETNLIDLSPQLNSVIPNFDSVQAIGWNGRYWLIGGVGFLVKYDGQNIIDLTPELNEAIGSRHIVNATLNRNNAVTAVAWNGNSWIIGGGAPLAITGPSTAWVATYNENEFHDITYKLPSYIANPTQTSTILTVTYYGDDWVLGGYANGKGVLLLITNSTTTDLSNLVSNMSTVNWVGAGQIGRLTQNHRIGSSMRR